MQSVLNDGRACERNSVCRLETIRIRSAQLPRLEWRADDGTAVSIRPICPDDAQLVQELVRSLSPETRYLRFMGAVRELSSTMLVRFTHVDYHRDMALIAMVGKRGDERPIAVARYMTGPGDDSCEFAIVVTDELQRRGIGRYLLMRLIDSARMQGLKTMFGDILAVNGVMLALVQSLGFKLGRSPGEPIVTRATLVLSECDRAHASV